LGNPTGPKTPCRTKYHAFDDAGQSKDDPQKEAFARIEHADVDGDITAYDLRITHPDD
jgi:hypothetical protein